MDFFVEIIGLIGRKMVEATAEALETPEARKVFDKRIRFVAEFLALFLLMVSILLPAYFFYTSYSKGQLRTEYFYVGMGFVMTAFLSHVFTAGKTIRIHQIATKPSNNIESTNVEDELRYEFGIAILLTMTVLIPGINLISLPLVMDRVLNILEITAPNTKREKARELSRTIAYVAMLIFLLSSMIFSLTLIILGDTRH